MTTAHTDTARGRAPKPRPSRRTTASPSRSVLRSKASTASSARWTYPFSSAVGWPWWAPGLLRLIAATVSTGTREALLPLAHEEGLAHRTKPRTPSPVRPSRSPAKGRLRARRPRLLAQHRGQLPACVDRGTSDPQPRGRPDAARLEGGVPAGSQRGARHQRHLRADLRGRLRRRPLPVRGDPGPCEGPPGPDARAGSPAAMWS